MVELAKAQVYYFGCIRESGHFIYDAHGRRNFHEMQHPWGFKIDGSLCPKGDPWTSGGQPQGEALLHHKDGWTALAFWDRSVDTRPGSNSVFFTDAVVAFDQMLDLARANFPAVFARFKFDITDASLRALAQQAKPQQEKV